MVDPFIYKTPSGKTVGDIIFKPLKDANVEMTVVDIGARNGMFLVPPSYAVQSNYIGFEPNPEEYSKLANRNTDAMKLGHNMPYFKSEKYYDCAIWNEEGIFPFYITSGPGACTMMGKANSKITKRMWLEGEEKNYEESHLIVKEITQIKCRRLDNIINPLMKVDFLKIDAEGADFAVLESAGSLLRSNNVLFIRTEFQAFPYYETHPLLGDQHVYLNRFGYRLIDIDLDHPRYTRDKSNCMFKAYRQAIYAGDAYFILDPDRLSLSAIDLQRLACLCLMFGFVSLAISFLRDARLLGDGEIDEIEMTLGRKWTKLRILSVWNKIPFEVAKVFRKLKIRKSTAWS